MKRVETRHPRDMITLATVMGFALFGHPTDHGRAAWSSELTWIEGTALDFSPSLRVDVSLPALLRTGNVSLLYSGVHDARAILAYRAPDLTAEDVILRAVREPASDEKTGTIWRIDATRLSTRYALAPERIAELQRDVKSALLSHPTWPREFQPNDPPLTAVEFILPK